MPNIDERLEDHAELRRDTPKATNANDSSVPSAVSVNWLAQVFRMDPGTVRKKLIHCPIKSQKQRGSKMASVKYDLPTAAAFLVTPQVSTREYLRAVKKGDLPPALQQATWTALLQRQRWEENAGQLWRTEKIREVLGSTFQTIKFTMQLWVDTIERQMELSEEQRKLIIELVDQLQTDIYDALVREAAETITGPQIQELPELVGETEPVALALADISEETVEDYEIEDLV